MFGLTEGQIKKIEEKLQESYEKYPVSESEWRMSHYNVHKLMSEVIDCLDPAKKKNEEKVIEEIYDVIVLAIRFLKGEMDGK